MIKDINKEIQKHSRNSYMLKTLYMGSKNMSYEKTLELQKQQDKEYKKMQFLINLKKEMTKK